MNLRLIARDYLVRARARREALGTLLAAHVHADVVREAHEVVELILKGALRFVGVEPPKRHDVEAIVEQFVDRLPDEWREALVDLRLALATLSADRSRAFYGDEERMIPASDLFTEADARKAIDVVERLLGMLERLVGEG